MRDLGIPYQQVRGMTVWELNRRAEGFRNKEKRKWQHTASIMAATLQPHSKQKVRPRHFVPDAYRDKAPQMDAKKIEQDINRKLRAYRKAKKNVDDS